MLALALLISVLPAAATTQDLLAVPSGQPVVFVDSIWDAPGPSGLTLRFRFVAPQIARDGGSVDFNVAEIDMAYLCENYALPRLSNIGPQANQIIISFSDRPVEFGFAAPDATQFFEAYRPEGTTCVWEGF